MSWYFCIALACSQDSSLSHQDDAKETNIIKQLLEMKQTTKTFAAEYEFQLPNVLSSAGGVHTVRFVMSEDGYYSENIRKTDSCKLLIKEGKAFFEYWDQQAGPTRVEGTVALKGKSPEKYVDDHGFVENSYELLDEDLLSRLSLVGPVKSVTDKSKSAIMQLRGIGKVLMTITDDGFSAEAFDQDVRRNGDKLVTYKFWGKPPETLLKRQQDFVAKFRVESSVITRLSNDSEFDFTSIILSIAQEGKKYPIPLQRLKKVAKEFGYLLPEIGHVTQANGVLAKRPEREIDLSVEFEKETYSIGEFIPKMDRSIFPAGSVKAERKFKGFSVVRYSDPGTGSTLTYFLGDQATYILNGDYLEDGKLERVIQSFSVPSVK